MVEAKSPLELSSLILWLWKRGWKERWQRSHRVKMWSDGNITYRVWTLQWGGTYLLPYPTSLWGLQHGRAQGSTHQLHYKDTSHTVFRTHAHVTGKIPRNHRQDVQARRPPPAIRIRASWGALSEGWREGCEPVAFYHGRKWTSSHRVPF